MNDFLRSGVWVLPQIKEFIKKEKGHFSPFPALIKSLFLCLSSSQLHNP